MADELSISCSLAFSKSGLTASLAFLADQLDVSGSNYHQNTQTVGTSEEALSLGDVATPGYIIVRNTDPTNYMEFRAGSGADDLVKVRPGGRAMFEFTTSTPYVIANSAPVKIEYLLIEA